MATILSYDEKNIVICAESIKKGNLVAFPTETVYGLGAHALDATACTKVFEVKGRPPTDPLIVHVLDTATAYSLWAPMDEKTYSLINALALTFWPGPLTMVYTAASHVPSVVCGGTPCVGVRIPVGSVARRLIEVSGVPIAAPSANRFGHISPTQAQHVYDDLAPYDSTLIVLDSGCGTDIGIESTVLRIHSADDIEILRKGTVTPSDLKSCLEKANLTTAIRVRDTQTKPKGHSEPQDGPGQLLTHYAPCLPTYLLQGTVEASTNLTSVRKTVSKEYIGEIQNAVVIDFGHRFGGEGGEALQGKVSKYFDMSPVSDPEEAARQLYATLRAAEVWSGASFIILPDLTTSHNEILQAVGDRLFRSASGERCELFKKES
eukprot:PhF_6_TR38718/c0_g1_i1/m.57948